jgi:hypothetical protein
VKTTYKRKSTGTKELSITAYREKRRKIFDLLRRGLSAAAVARECGLSRTRVVQVMKRGGVRRALSWKNEAVTVLVERKRDTPGAETYI